MKSASSISVHWKRDHGGQHRFWSYSSFLTVSKSMYTNTNTNILPPALSPWQKSRCWPGWRAGGRWCWQESFSSCTPRNQDDGQQGWFKFKHVSIIVEDQKVKRNCIKYLPNILFPNVLCKHIALKGFSATIILRKLRLCCFDGITFQILFLCVKIWTTLARDKPCRHLSVKMFRPESSGVETQSRRDSERMKRLSNRVTH